MYEQDFARAASEGIKNVDEGTLSYARKPLMSLLKAAGATPRSVVDNFVGTVSNLCATSRQLGEE